jgi:hypothetical protein
MRVSNALTHGLALTMTLAAAGGASAHRRDEHLQAARIALQPDGVQVELDLTPGIDVAESTIAAIDRDRDGSLSADEGREYAALVMGALTLTLDGARLPLRLEASTVPHVEAVRRGEGTIRLQARASLSAIAPGPHQLEFRNTHLTGRSAYLANALVPDSPRISITAQRRDRDQTELTVAYAVRPAASVATSVWLLVALTVAAFLGVRHRHVPRLERR